MASAGWRKKEGVPVEARVALIFLQMIPDLPRPMVMTRPAQAFISSTTSTKVWSRCSIRPRMAADSTSRTRFASASAGWSSFFRSGDSDIGRDGISSSPLRRSGGKSPGGLQLLRQQRGVHRVEQGSGHTGRASHPDDRAELGVELRRFAVEDIALHGGGGVGREGVDAVERPLAGVGEEGDAAGGGDGKDLTDGPFRKCARLGDGAPDAARHARDGADAAQDGDEEELAPHRAVNVGRDVDADAGKDEGLAQALQPLAAPVVELSEVHERVDAGVTDVPRSNDEADDAAQAAAGVLRSENGGELFGGFEAVLGS